MMEGGDGHRPPGQVSESAVPDTVPEHVAQDIQNQTAAAAVKKAFQLENSVQLKENEAVLDDIPEDSKFTRTYRLRAMPPNGFLRHLEHIFKSSILQTIVIYRIEGQDAPALYLVFDENHKDCESDFEKSAKLQIKINGRLIDILPENASNLDDDCFIQPKLMKHVIVNGLPGNLAKNQEFLVEFLKDYMEFESQRPFSIIGENGRFKGKMTAPVKNFKALPERRLRVPMIYKNKDGEMVKSEKSTTEIMISCLGFDKTASGPKRVVKATLHCNYCRNDGHVITRCPKLDRKNRRWKCKDCHRTDSGCTYAKCNNEKDILDGVFNTEQRPQTIQHSRTFEQSSLASNFTMNLPPSVTGRSSKRRRTAERNSRVTFNQPAAPQQPSSQIAGIPTSNRMGILGQLGNTEIINLDDVPTSLTSKSKDKAEGSAFPALAKTSTNSVSKKSENKPVNSSPENKQGSSQTHEASDLADLTLPAIKDLPLVKSLAANKGEIALELLNLDFISLEDFNVHPAGVRTQLKKFLNYRMVGDKMGYIPNVLFSDDLQKIRAAQADKMETL